ncbi:hypothetical protein N7474_007365, partial [Penicillium riverlandense]|uniref:uncharacterized protein n=1 Tax=Penicillium riverlandense TaxID=1903569 RepID=UPI0025465F2A
IAYVGTVLYSPTALFVKTSLIYILIRVFHPIYSGLIALYCLLGLVICYYFIIMFVKIFICHPVSAYWDLAERTNGSCLRLSSLIIADSAVSFVTDAAILASPVALTWSLQMPARKKLRVICILGLGGVAVGFALFRLVIGVHERENRHNTVVFLRSILTGNAELGIGLICACLPALTALATHHREQPSSGRQQKRSQSSSNAFEESELMQRQPRRPARPGSTVSSDPSAGQ